MVTCPGGGGAFGRTKGFWGNKNGHAELDPGGDGTVDTPVTLGIFGPTTRSVTVNTIAGSDKILSNHACESAGPAIITCAGPAPDGLSPGPKRNTLEVLMAQTLAISYKPGVRRPRRRPRT